MKMAFTTAFAVITALVASSCNKQIFDFKFRFDKAYVKWPDGSMKVIEVKQWNDYQNSDQIQVIGTDGTTYLFHACNVTLVSEGKRR